MSFKINKILWHTDCAYGKPGWVHENIQLQPTPKCDATLIGTIKTFLNDWSIEFCKNGAYYLKDPQGCILHFCSYSNRERMFAYLQRIDKQINFASKEEMGKILFVFTSKPNKWLNNKK